jgi:hypothetical protein
MKLLKKNRADKRRDERNRRRIATIESRVLPFVRDDDKHDTTAAYRAYHAGRIDMVQAVKMGCSFGGGLR